MASITKICVLRKEICPAFSLLQRSFTLGQTRAYPQETSGKGPAPPSPPPAAPRPSSSPTQVNANVPGLSQAVLTTEEPVGPGASKSGEYKVPEYFNYNKNSYFEAEVEMLKYRLPQPSALKK